MSNTLVYGVAAIIFALQLILCFITENRIIRKLPMTAAILPVAAGIGYMLFYKTRNAWKGFVTAVYLYVAIVWFAAAIIARTAYNFINKNKKSD